MMNVSFPPTSNGRKTPISCSISDVKRVALELHTSFPDLLFPPRLGRMLWNNGCACEVDVTDDQIRFPSDAYILDEWKHYIAEIASQSENRTIKIANRKGSATAADRFFSALTPWEAEYNASEKKVRPLRAPQLAEVAAADAAEDYATALALQDSRAPAEQLVCLFDRYFRRSDLTTCGEILSVLKHRPSWEAAECEAHYWHVMNDQEQAARCIVKSLHLGTIRPHRCLNMLGLIAARHDQTLDFSAALVYFDEAFSKLQECSLSLEDESYEWAVIANAKALALFRLREFDDAIMLLKMAISKISDSDIEARRQFLALVHDSVGMVALHQEFRGWDQLCHDHFSSAINIYPKYHQYHKDFASFYFRLGDTDTAIRHMEQAVRLHPSSVSMREQLIDLYESRDMLDAANNHLHVLARRSFVPDEQVIMRVRVNEALRGDFRATEYLTDVLGDLHGD